MTTIFASPEIFSQKIYWLNRLSGELPETNLLPDYMRPSQSHGEKETHIFDVPHDLSQAIIKLTKGSDFLIYLILLSAFNILLEKYTRSPDLIVGIPAYQNRNKDNLGVTSLNKHQIVPLRTYLQKELTFKKYLIDVKESVIQAYSHQDYCFDELIELLNLPLSENRYPLFDVVILLENIHDQSQIIKYHNDITVSFRIENGVIKGEIAYVPEIFKRENIQLVSYYYINVIKSIVLNPHIQISEINILNSYDQHKILEEFNYKTSYYPVDKTINYLFEKQVNHTPNQIAVIDQNNQLTYQQLNETANQLAAILRQLGVCKGELIGILKDRDINFLVAILAIYKAGGAYVPIDTTYPAQRIEYMLSNSEVRFLLTDSTLLNLLADVSDRCSQLKSIICVDEVTDKSIQLNLPQELAIYDRLSFSQLSPENIPAINDADTPAYMIYTSGSTGLPKGTLVRHDGAINHIYAQFDELELSSEFSFLQSAPSSTDISVWQFLSPILIGGKTVIVDIETVAIPQQLFQVLKSAKITVVELVPVLFGGLLEYAYQLPPEERELPDLKVMMLSGESVSIQLVNKWLEIYPKINIFNAYGPTEAADDITQFVVDKALPENQRTIPIGKPLANLNLYILDQQMQLLPIGAPGEICVSGIGVGAGYWKNPERTQLSFVDNPFPDTQKNLPANRRNLIYKTGDLGRWLPDGNIEFLGRIDHQVKIRGFRVELGEIEALLYQHQDVREAVVVVREEKSDQKILVGYVVPQADFTLEESKSHELIQQLRDLLEEQLPGHMRPHGIVLLEALPLSPSGKIDRRALPVPNFQNESELGFVAPRTPSEQIVAGIWGQVLKQEQIGIYDNFFDLGGHSLLATQAISRLKEAFAIEFPLRNIFEAPTIVQLVERIEKMLTVKQLQLVSSHGGDNNREEIEL
ncbi:non-ribosomal peptide synthetase [Calothrix sp. PCC 6303]|uniref:non-ribosomal peptide synthetase n=1 Tax=Calothrix sp. PCC 6303 TaxID=1170562 RepID=UPI0002A02085|nr:non-ribosomal peptide synthetase [Calothrix sp. PCC 6303]AFZ01578.1 amino acid adenylation domain protein [Calothrix sp. PCC 6303]